MSAKESTMSRTLYIKKCAPIDLYYVSTKSSQEFSDGVSTKSQYLCRMGQLHPCVGASGENGTFFVSVEEAKSVCEIWGFTPVEDCHPSKFLKGTD